MREPATERSGNLLLRNARHEEMERVADLLRDA
jgi:hypothetical protein